MEKELMNILEKVSNLYRKYGIKSITMDDVAKELGISKKTLYQYVSDKSDLVEKVIKMIFEKPMQYIADIEKGNLNAIEKIIKVNKFITDLLKSYTPTMEYDLVKYYPDLFKRVCETRRDKILESIVINMEKGIEEGLFRKDLNIQIIAKLHLVRIENMFNNDIFTIEEITSNAVFNEIFNYHLHGIANVNGIKYLEKRLKEINQKNNEKEN